MNGSFSVSFILKAFTAQEKKKQGNHNIMQENTFYTIYAHHLVTRLFSKLITCTSAHVQPYLSDL